MLCQQKFNSIMLCRGWRMCQATMRGTAGKKADDALLAETTATLEAIWGPEAFRYHHEVGFHVKLTYGRYLQWNVEARSLKEAFTRLWHVNLRFDAAALKKCLPYRARMTGRGTIRCRHQLNFQMFVKAIAALSRKATLCYMQSYVVLHRATRCCYAELRRAMLSYTVLPKASQCCYAELRFAIHRATLFYTELRGAATQS